VKKQTWNDKEQDINANWRACLHDGELGIIYIKLIPTDRGECSNEYE